jgi:hypothetical protein
VSATEQHALEYADALAWFVVHRGKVLEVVLRSGGLVLEGMARYEDVTEDRGSLGVALCGLTWWITESAVTYVTVDPVTDALFVQMEDDNDGRSNMLLTPRSTF